MKLRIRQILISVTLVFPLVFIAASYLEDLMETGGQEGSGEIVGMITGLPTRLMNLGSNAGYPGIFLLTLLDSAGFPFPSEIILPLAGYLVYIGALQYWPVVLYSTVAALLGSSADYYIGRKFGTRLIRGQVRLPYVSAKHLQRVQAWFDVHGPAAVALFRLVPAARVLISFPAGACEMNPITFEFYTLIGCLTWDVVLVYLGWWLGSSWGTVTALFRNLSLFIYFAMFIIFAVWILSPRRLTKRLSH
jgi:membrane protein DedA with SNARE-associated domain